MAKTPQQKAAETRAKNKAAAEEERQRLAALAKAESDDTEDDDAVVIPDEPEFDENDEKIVNPDDPEEEEEAESDVEEVVEEDEGRYKNIAKEDLDPKGIYEVHLFREHFINLRTYEPYTTRKDANGNSITKRTVLRVPGRKVSRHMGILRQIS